MPPNVRAGLILAAATLSMSSAALAQTQQPANAKTGAAVVTKWITEETPGQWRASKLIGLNVYNDDNEKIGGVTELIVDQSGKLEAVVVGAGGFLGLGEHDVAIPYGQISWVYSRGAKTPANTAPSSTEAASTADRNPESAHPSADKAALDAVSARPYPDHAVVNMTKEELKAAPPFKFAR
jgi:sporulation protein YlmC with PRC-barrel domain